MKKRRNLILVLSSVIVLSLAAFVSIETYRAKQQEGMRAQVYYWIRSMEWWDYSGTESENERRQLEGLRSLDGGALAILERDLGYNPAALKLLERIPLLQRFVPRPNIVDEPQNVRHRAVYFLGLLGADAKRSVPALLRLVSDSDQRVRLEVAFALGRIGVASSEVRTALTNMLSDSDKDVVFSATISLWNFDRTDPANIERVEKLISSTSLSWASICLMKLGANARIFASSLADRINGMPWSHARMQAVHALWSMTKDKQLVLRELESLANALDRETGTNSVTGWTDVERAVGYVVHRLDDEKDFRDRVRPMLETILKNPSSQARRTAAVYSRTFDELDRREKKDAQGAAPSQEPSAPPPKPDGARERREP